MPCDEPIINDCGIILVISSISAAFDLDVRFCSETFGDELMPTVFVTEGFTIEFDAFSRLCDVRICNLCNKDLGRFGCGSPEDSVSSVTAPTCLSEKRRETVIVTNGLRSIDVVCMITPLLK